MTSNISNFKFDSIESALEDIKAGKMIIVVDDENRENEGDFVMAADLVTPEQINFMAKYGRGMICAPISKEIATKLKLRPMVTDNNSTHETAFTVTIDAKDNISTGISAADRAHTIKLLTNAETKFEDFVTPGHIFPLIAKPHGVLERNGHTEASVDLAKLAGLNPVGVICEIMNEDGSMSRLSDLIELKEKFNLKLITIKDLADYRHKKELNIEHIETVPMPSKFGNFDLHLFKRPWSDKEIIVISKGNIQNANNITVRLHSECFTGDVLGSQRCDCGEQLNKSLELIEKNNNGVVIYLRQEGRGIGLINKIKAYKLQDNGLDTVEANHQLGLASDLRQYDDAYAVLKYFNINSIELITNNPQKMETLEKLGMKISKKISIPVTINQANEKYLFTKKIKLGHSFNPNMWQ